MAASYRDFWIIVSMTVGAVVMAYSNAKPPRIQTEAEERAAEPAAVAAKPQPLPPSTPNAGPFDENKTGDEPAPKPPRPAIAGYAAIPSRDLDPEIRTAFNDAMRTVLAENTDTDPDDVEESETADRSRASSNADISSGQPSAAEVNAPGKPEAEPSQSGKTGIARTGLNVREGPGAAYVLVATLPAGATVTVIEEEGGWLHVLYAPAGSQGWVNGRYIDMGGSAAQHSSR